MALAESRCYFRGASCLPELDVDKPRGKIGLSAERLISHAGAGEPSASTQATEGAGPFAAP